MGRICCAENATPNVTLPPHTYAQRKQKGNRGDDVKEYTNSEIKVLISEHIHNERDRKILERRLCDGVTFDGLSEEFNLSVQRIKVIVYKAQSRLFRYLK